MPAWVFVVVVHLRGSGNREGDTREVAAVLVHKCCEGIAFNVLIVAITASLTLRDNG